MQSQSKFRVYWNFKIIVNAYYLQELKSCMFRVLLPNTRISKPADRVKSISDNFTTWPDQHFILDATWLGLFFDLLNLRVRDLRTDVLSWPQWWKTVWPPVRLLNQACWKIVFGFTKCTENQTGDGRRKKNLMTPTQQNTTRLSIT